MKDGSKKEVFWFVLLVFLSLSLFFFDKKGHLKSIRGLIERPIMTVEKEVYSLNISISSYLNIFSSRKSQQAELLRLQVELQRLAVDQNKLLTCQAENEKIKKLLGAPLPASWKFLLSPVAGVSDLMRLDKGEKAGVKAGMNVVSENILVGKVLKAGDYHCLVELPTTNGTKIPVVIKRPDSDAVQARGLLLGQYGGQLLLDKVLQAEDIQKGDLVVSSGDEDFLGDLLIGQISEVLGKSAEVYQKARVRPFLDYQKLAVVFIVIR